MKVCFVTTSYIRSPGDHYARFVHEQAKSLLSNRGIPFTEKSLSTQEELAELSSKLGVKAALPCMTVGTQRQLGFESEAWNKLLDLAGYPKKSSAPAQ